LPSADEGIRTGESRPTASTAAQERKEVTAMESRPADWEAPDFEEIGCAPEVTMYVAQLES
jgi:coenzyme PQQ precursor peptide PqqA